MDDPELFFELDKRFYLFVKPVSSYDSSKSTTDILDLKTDHLPAFKVTAKGNEKIEIWGYNGYPSVDKGVRDKKAGATKVTVQDISVHKFSLKHTHVKEESRSYKNIIPLPDWTITPIGKEIASYKLQYLLTYHIPPNPKFQFLQFKCYLSYITNDEFGENKNTGPFITDTTTKTIQIEENHTEKLLRHYNLNEFIFNN